MLSRRERSGPGPRASSMRFHACPSETSSQRRWTSRSALSASGAPENTIRPWPITSTRSLMSSAMVSFCSTSRTATPRRDLVRIDAGCVVDGFSSDVGRTFVVGEPDKVIKTRYAAIRSELEAELALVRAPHSRQFQARARNGAAGSWADLQPWWRRQPRQRYRQPARRVIVREGAPDLLEPGMCFCLETPYYQIGWGGMMVEDTVLVTSDGYSPISRLSRELFQL